MVLQKKAWYIQMSFYDNDNLLDHPIVSYPWVHPIMEQTFLHCMYDVIYFSVLCLAGSVTAGGEPCVVRPESSLQNHG